MTPISYEDYLKRSGDDDLSNDGPMIRNEHGFMIWSVNGTEFHILQCYGDGKYWDDISTNMARTMGLKKVVFTTRRNPETYKRRFGFRLHGYIMSKEV